MLLIGAMTKPIVLAPLFHISPMAPARNFYVTLHTHINLFSCRVYRTDIGELSATFEFRNPGPGLIA
jgi:hypothetical protein